jgi:anti-sigma B factor antagonist
MRGVLEGVLAMHDQLTIEVESSGPDVVLRLAGELDLATAPMLQSALESLRMTCRNVVLDLSALTYLDSTGLGLMGATFQRFEPEMRLLTLRSPRGLVAQVLELSGLSALVRVEDLPALA